MTFFVGSTNPVKLKATAQAAARRWPSALVEGFAVASGVSEQPLSDEETRRGAHQRALAALAAGRAAHPDLTAENALGVGLEGGVFTPADAPTELWSTVWVVIVDDSGRHWESNGMRLQLPEKIAAAIREGGEMGPAVSQLIGGSPDLKQKQGMIGVITNNYLDRAEGYQAIATLALGLWHGREWEAQITP